MKKVCISFWFNPKILKKYFDNKVREQCKSCKRYTFKATCPPYCDSIDYYKKLLPTYKNGRLIIYKYTEIDLIKWEEQGEESSKQTMAHLTALRNELLKLGHCFIVGFSAGSCKNCKECSFPCRFPDKSFVPIEATGLNVIKLTKDITHQNIKFPVIAEFFRIGMMLWV
jgi:predicted metal-binding protein